MNALYTYRVAASGSSDVVGVGARVGARAAGAGVVLVRSSHVALWASPLPLLLLPPLPPPLPRSLPTPPSPKGPTPPPTLDRSPSPPWALSAVPARVASKAFPADAVIGSPVAG